MKLFFILILSAVLIMPAVAMATDDENCLMCHKYPGLGRYAKDKTNLKAVKRIFYVNEEQFSGSYHGKLRCKSCHEGVEEIPHTGVKRVDCASDCHLKDPSTGRDFSHKAIVEDLRQSAHGEEGARSENKDDLPGCKDCHSNKNYQEIVKAQVKSLKFLKVCLECHESEAWAERFYEHMFYRVSNRRSSKQVVALCSKCHADPAKMERNELDVVVGFKDTFHGKAILYGDEEVADCLSCHAPYEMGFSPHRIQSRQTQGSPVHPDKKLETCQQVGCHAGAAAAFAEKGRVHPSNIKVAAVDDGGVTLSQSEQEFQAWVLDMIKLFYKVLIIAVVGGLGMHRLLDLYATRREHKIAHRASKLGGH
jgi:hypothetical protein